MPALQLALLGPIQVFLAGQPLRPFPISKVQALLAYLAVEVQTPHARDTLIGLLWPEYTTESARQNFRQALFRLRQTIPPDYLLATNQTVQFNAASDYRLDVTTFTDLITACRRHAHPDLTTCAECSERLEQAVALYRGEFLAGFFLDDSPAFEEWMVLKREWLRREVLQALADLAVFHERAGVYAQAQAYAWRQVELDPPREEAHQQLMRVLALSGRRSEALAQYESCRRLLAEELGVEPSAETVALDEQIRAGKLGKRPESPLPAAAQPVAPSLASVRTPAAAPATPSAGEAMIRLVTVLCVGVSDAEELHPEAAAQAGERLGQLSAPILAHYEARLEASAGAGLVALFGATQTHEDDPERAVRAALAMRTAASSAGLVVSAGVSTGNILLGPSGAPVGPNTFAGSAVSLAVRLQGQAAPGQLLVGESTYRQTQAAIQFTPLPLALPGRSYTRTVYQAEHPRVRPQKSRGLAPLRADLVGRTKELAELKHALAAMQAGEGQLVVLIGEAGIGKSRLVTELKQAAGAADEHPTSQLRWLEGRCLEMMISASYWPFLDLLHTSLGWQPADEEDRRAGGIVVALDALVAAGHLTPAQREEMGPLLGNLLSVRFGTDWDERLKFAEPEQIRHQTLLTLRAFFVALAHQQPLVLVLEDLHWADSLSLDLITLLMEGLAEQPLLLLCVYRPEPQHRCWQLATLATAKCPDRLTEVRLRELTPRQSQQLVEALLTIENLPPQVKATILQKAQGNPLFVEEVIRSLIDTGIVYRQGETWCASAAIETVVVPESIQSVILSRVDRLGEGLKGVLQRAAVIGRLFSRRLLVQLVPPEVDLDNVVLALTNQAFIYQERVVPEEEYSFKHVLVQEAIYQTMLRERQEQSHRQVAEAMEQFYADNLAERYEQLAYHYDRSGVIEKAIEYLLNAGEKARRSYLNDAAIHYFQRALEQLEKSPPDRRAKEWRLEARQGFGQTYFGTGKLAEAEVAFQQAIALGREIGLAADELVRLYHWLGEVLWWQQRYDEQIRIGEEGLALVGDNTESTGAALMNQTIALGHAYLGNAEKTQELSERTAHFIGRLPYSEELRPAYLHLAVTCRNHKRIEEAQQWLQALEQKAQRHHDLRALAGVHLLMGALLADSGNFHGAMPHRRQALDLFIQIGDTKQAFSRAGEMMRHCLVLGELQKAEEYADRGVAMVESDFQIKNRPGYHILMSTLVLCQGGRYKEIESFQQAIQHYQAGGLRLATSLYALGRVFWLQGERAEAMRRFHEVLALTHQEERVSGQALLVASLSGLEAAYDDAEGFQAFCHHFRQEHRHGSERMPLGSRTLVQWYLTPTQPTVQFTRVQFEFQVTAAQTLKSALEHGEWTWHDKFSDCSFALDNGLTIQAANGRDLAYLNLSAPRLLGSTIGDFALQAVSLPASDGKPTQGGILLWRDKEHYLRLDRGALGTHEITFQGCLSNTDVFIGRGRLTAERIFLRLERVGERVNALCSTDGEQWFSVGHMDFPVDDPVQVGLHAIGMIDRLIYPGAHPDGTAILFESFTVYSSQ
jgi:predicted ATPase/DNA-binding SARP family transcriptional activator